MAHLFRLLVAGNALLGATLTSAQTTFPGDRLKGDDTQHLTGAENVLPRADVIAPEDALRRFSLPPGFEIQIVASEPLVSDPVAMAFDAKGRMWVVEMPNFDLLGQREFAGLQSDPTRPAPKGRVVVLTDKNGDGRMDERTVFLEDPALPNTIAFLGDGVLVGLPPKLLLCYDRNGDGKADDITTVTEDFRKSGNIEDSPNGLVWNMDNWLYNSEYPFRLRFQEGNWIREAVPLFGQWGLTQDDFGRLYFNNNSESLRASLYAPHYIGGDARKVLQGVSANLAPDRTIWPLGPTPGVGRGYRKGQLRDDGTQATVTGAGGALIYRGTNFPERYRGNAFVAETSANLVRRNLVFEKEGRMQAENAFDRAEFLTSTDERFRPVFLANGPDGTLYVVDMHRGVMTGWPWMTTYLRDQVLQRGLHLPPFGLGRIYRVLYSRRPVERATDLAGATPMQLVAALTHSNGWTRDTAQRRIVDSNDAATFRLLLEHLLRSGASPTARLHALWCLDALRAVESAVIVEALRDPASPVRMAALRISEPFLTGAGGEALLRVIRDRIDDEEPEVLVQIALSLGKAGDSSAGEILWNLLPRAAEHPSLLDAIAIGLGATRAAVLQRLLVHIGSRSTPAFSEQPLLRALAADIVRRGGVSEQQKVVAMIADESRPRWARAALVRGLSAAASLDATATNRGIAVKLDGEIMRGLSGISDAFVLRLAKPILEQAERQPPTTDQKGPLAPLTEKEKVLFGLGKMTYAATCAVCHQPDGLGREGVAPALVGSRWVLSETYHVPGRIVLNGKEGTPGFPAPMGPLNLLSDEQIAGVLTYIRRAWGNDAAAISPEDIAHVRVSVRARDRGWTDQDLDFVNRRFK